MFGGDPAPEGRILRTQAVSDFAWVVSDFAWLPLGTGAGLRDVFKDFAAAHDGFGHVRYVFKDYAGPTLVRSKPLGTGGLDLRQR